MASAATLPSWVLLAGSGNGRTLTTHRNAGIEIVYVEEGNLPWQVEGCRQPVGPASVFFTMPWQWHGSTADFEPGHHWNFAVVKVEGDCFDHPGPLRLPEELGFSKAQQRRIVGTLSKTSRHVWPASEPLAQAMRSLVRDYRAGGSFCRQRCAAWAIVVLTELEQTIRENRTAPPLMPSGKTRIERLLTELNSHLDKPWALGTMAAFCGLKRTQFVEMVRIHTGDTPSALLNRLRVEHARCLLRKSSQTITEIAFECGFCSSQYFARVFRSLTGVPASEYRAKPE